MRALSCINQDFRMSPLMSERKIGLSRADCFLRIHCTFVALAIIQYAHQTVVRTVQYDWNLMPTSCYGGAVCIVVTSGTTVKSKIRYFTPVLNGSCISNLLDWNKSIQKSNSSATYNNCITWYVVVSTVDELKWQTTSVKRRHVVSSHLFQWCVRVRVDIGIYIVLYLYYFKWYFRIDTLKR